MSGVQTIQVETMLLNWSETPNGGAKLVLQLASPDDLEPFKAMTLKKGNRAGQRLVAVFVEVDENEQPVPQEVKDDGKAVAHRLATSKFPLGLCGLAVRWCDDENFEWWMRSQFAGRDYENWAATDTSKDMLLRVCGIKSRKELDTNDAAALVFLTEIKNPYIKYRREKGLD